jgi:uncharacterized phiE125 gp8 family phage protein
MHLQVLARSPYEPLSVAQVKDNLRITSSNLDYDSLILGWIAAARQKAEHYCNRALVPQRIVQSTDSLDPQGQRIVSGPVQSLLLVQYVDSSGALTTLAPSAYQLDASQLPARVFPAVGTSWPQSLARAGAVKITAEVGYAPFAATEAQVQASVPACVRQWLQAEITVYSEQRSRVDAQSLAEQNHTYDSLLDPETIYWAPSSGLSDPSRGYRA